MRTTRKATSIVIAAALALSVAACAGGDTKPGAVPTKATGSVSAAPTITPAPTPSRRADSVMPSDDNPLGIDWVKQAKHPFTGDAADKFGADNVMDAYRHAVTFSLQEGYSNLMAKGYDARPVEFSFVKPYLTTAAQKAWDEDVKAALTRDADAVGQVSLLTTWNAAGGQNVYTFRDGQVLFSVGRTFSTATTSLQTVDAKQYLVIRFTVSRNLRFMKDGKPVLFPLEKDITYRMTPNGLKDIPWLIDSWTIESTPGLPTPDPLGTVS